AALPGAHPRVLERRRRQPGLARRGRRGRRRDPRAAQHGRRDDLRRGQDQALPAGGARLSAPPAAVVFDLDGVLIDSEERWTAAREALVREAGGTWTDSATRDMMGMSAPEWSAYLRDELGVPMSAREINDAVVERMQAGYRESVPLLDGAVESVRGLASRWPLGVASSANAPLIALVLEVAGIAGCFAATVSSEEVP